jgi:hypothetical protein
MGIACQNALVADIDLVRGRVRTAIAAGYSDWNQILEEALEAAEDDGEELGRDDIARIAVEEASAYEQRQAQWPPITDYDRLHSAFVALNDRDIVARENFSCCGNCGAGEIWEEIREHGATARGYTFFHMQDTDGAVDVGSLYLSYGATEPGEEPALAVAHEIVAALREHGVRADWNGSWSTRIHAALDWQRRRPVDWLRSAPPAPA